MFSSRLSFILSGLLIVVNLIFLYAIVGYKDCVSNRITPGLTVGIAGFVIVIVFAVVLTWIYVQIVNQREK
jgi:uncharacterized membrane protein (DUF485 family)